MTKTCIFNVIVVLSRTMGCLLGAITISYIILDFYVNSHGKLINLNC